MFDIKVAQLDEIRLVVIPAFYDFQVARYNLHPIKPIMANYGKKIKNSKL